MIDHMLSLFAALRLGTRHNLSRLWMRLLAVFAALFVLALPAHAVTKTWNGSNGSWNTAASWSPAGVPATTDDVVVNAGTVTLTASTTVASLSCASSGAATIDNIGFLLSINGATNTSCDGVITGGGGLSKLGAGTLTLSRTNTYSGATTVSAGTLRLGVNHS